MDYAEGWLASNLTMVPKLAKRSSALAYGTALAGSTFTSREVGLGNAPARRWGQSKPRSRSDVTNTMPSLLRIGAANSNTSLSLKGEALGHLTSEAYSVPTFRPRNCG